MVYGPVAGLVRKEAIMGKFKEQELVLLRGLPGSGKTWMARRFAFKGYVHLEADHFFERPQLDGTVKYEYDPRMVPAAHAQCRQLTREALRGGNSVVVANTFIRKHELQPYLNIARQYSVAVRIIVMRGRFQSVHDVPASEIEQMRQAFEE